MRSRRKNDGLNVVPFIDIMLVLLCIVLSVSTFIATGKIQVELPQSKSGVKTETEKPIIITINEDNQIFYDDEILTEDEILKRVEEIGPKSLIVLKSDKNAKFDSFIKVIDILKQKQHENFAITTETKN